MPTELDRPYCTLSEVQDETQNNRPEDIEILSRAINRASREIDEYLRRDFLFRDNASVPLSVPLSYCAENVIFLPWPVLTLTEISIVVPPDPAAVLPSTDYTFENSILSATSKIFRAGSWKAADSYGKVGILPSRSMGLPIQILLKGTFGYVPAQKDSENDFSQPAIGIPQSIRTACAVLAGIRSGKLKKEIVDLNGQRNSVTTRTIPKDVADMLARYRIENIP